MSELLEFTGERFTPECQREIWYEHLHRYALASELCRGLVVLDAACGEGYGSSLLAGTALSVTGVDVSRQAVEHAQSRYGQVDNLEFKCADCADLPFDDHQFEAIVSFETLEHLHNQEGMLSEFRRVLKPGGFLVISSPDKAIYTDKMGIDNEFHVSELYREEFEALLSRHFPCFRMMAQKLVFQSAIWPLDQADTVRFQQLNSNHLINGNTVLQDSMYLIALCADSEQALPAAARSLWLFDDADETVYSHYHGEVQRNMAAGGIIAERDQQIEQLKQQVIELKEQGGNRSSWWSRLFGRG